MAAKKASGSGSKAAKTTRAIAIDAPPLDAWSDLIGHDRLIAGLSAAIQQGRLGGSLLFVGPSGVGKTSAAVLLTQTLLCERSSPEQMAPCNTCPACVQVRAGTHPDFIQVSKPDDKTLIPLELLIGPVDARLQEGFCHDVHLRPMQAKRKVAILHDADFLNEEGANCLLKTLEEPPANALIILIGSSEQRQLPTIRSRCQVLRFQSPTGEHGRQLLRKQLQWSATEDDELQVDSVSDEALDAAIELSAGDMHVAIRLVRGGGDKIREALWNQLDAPVPDPVAIARLINGHLDSISKDVPKRRAALRDVFSIAVQHYRRQLRNDAKSGEYDPATHRRLDRTLRTFREIDRSANLGTLVDCYAADLTLATTGDRGAIG
ncbi:DNA polymerase III subunit [Rhodopirellula halodulae]|uniref:DNA polymerase III subunit n=1 Tax=Rhodopirellula halodulae TaxID=2894198 RepID=UPI001E465571|nr:DNA polymerase III subunit [Rhodopirellula sp. JC737]MCC9656111.1 AAA family ATPase [Rhodopirellula sp. JC737]